MLDDTMSQFESGTVALLPVVYETIPSYALSSITSVLPFPGAEPLKLVNIPS